ncbi:MAG: SrfA family protein [Succinivibrio sp.]
MKNSYRINGGSVRDYVPIGVDGRPVWKNAEAFLRSIVVSGPLGNEAARHLAEPEFSDGGEHVDWFVGFPPRSSQGYEVVRWDSASPEERRAAWQELERFGSSLEVYGRDLEKKALGANDELFAHYLTGTSGYEKLPAIHFPSSDCVFIVDGTPVVTFWGFLRPGQTLGGSPFQALAPSDGGNPFAGTAASSGAAAAAPGAGAAGAAAGAAAVPWWRRHLLCLILLPALLVLAPLLAYLLWWLLFAHPLGLPAFGAFPDLMHGSLEPMRAEASLAPSDDDDEAVVRDRGSVVVDGASVRGGLDAQGAAPAAGEAEDEAVLPGASAPDASAGENDAKDAAAAGNDKAGDDAAAGKGGDDQDKAGDGQDAGGKAADDAAAKDAAADGAKGNDPKVVPPELGSTDENGNLVLDPKELSKGSLRGLDGTWNTSSGLFDTRTGKPVSIKYNFDNGKGTAEVTRSDGTKCSTSTSGSVAGGGLEIAGGLVPCSDGTKISLPKVRCTPGKDGKADCSGIYGSKQENIKMDLYR